LVNMFHLKSTLEYYILSVCSFLDFILSKVLNRRWLQYLTTFFADNLYAQKEDVANSPKYTKYQNSMLKSEKSLLQGRNSEHLASYEVARGSWTSWWSKTNQESNCDFRWVRTSVFQIFVDELPFSNKTLKAVTINETLSINFFVPAKEEVLFARRKKKNRYPMQPKQSRISIDSVTKLTRCNPSEKVGEIRVEISATTSRKFGKTKLDDTSALDVPLEREPLDDQEIGQSDRNKVGRKKFSVFLRKGFLCCIRPPSDH